MKKATGTGLPSRTYFCARQTPTISLILLTHPTISHLGAYVHCCKHIPLFDRIPVYATTPTISFGRTLIQDLYASTPLASSTLPATALAELSPVTTAHGASNHTQILLPRPSDDELAGFFSHIHPLKYSQEHQPIGSSNTAPLEGLTITAYPAGHTVGGTLWHIRYGSESVVYGVDWNQARENVMSGAAWLAGGTTTGSEVIEQLRQPTAFICSSKDSQKMGVVGGWRARDEQLFRHIRTTIQQNATALIPCDSSARVLELSYLLERAWADSAEFKNAKLYLASRTGDATMKYARSMLEWMDENVVREFETQAASRSAQNSTSKGSQPFDFKHLKLLERKSQLERALASSGPKIFLASGETMEWGFSRDIFMRTYANSATLIIIPIKPKPQDRTSQSDSQLSVVDRLLMRLEDENVATQLNEDFQWREAQITNLGADEAALYQQFLARERRRLDATSLGTGTTLEASTDAADEHSLSSSSSEDSDDEHQGRVLNTSVAMQHSKRKFAITDEELGINVLLRRKNAHDYDVRGKKGRERVVPFIARRKRNDEFGDVIRPEEYLRAEERDDMDAEASPDELNKGNTRIGQKRRLDGKEAGGGDNIRSAETRANGKRRKVVVSHDTSSRKVEANHTGAGAESSDEMESEESDYEPAEPVVLGPQKVTFSTRTLSVKAKVVAVDFAGIHDKRSLQMLLPLIRPRKLILTAGSVLETQMMESDCARILGSVTNKEETSRTTAIHVARNNQVIDASVDTNAWSLRLSRSLLSGLHWQKYRQLGVVTIDGQLEETLNDDEESKSLSKRPKLEGDAGRGEPVSDLEISTMKAMKMPVLNALPSSATAMTRSFTQSNHVGDLRLAELRKILQDRGHVAQFKGEGTLLVDDHIAVRKNGIGKIEIESGGGFAAVGSFGTGLYTVKQKIYEGLATVAAR